MPGPQRPLTQPLQLQLKAVEASIGTSFGITLLIALVFCALRPYNAAVYAPRLRFADEKHAPPAIGRGPFAWFKPVISTKEQDLVDKVGLDAAVFIRFTKMCRNIFLILTVVGCGIIIPVTVVTGNAQKFSAGVSGDNVLLKTTPQYMVGQIFWAFVGAAWVIDIIVCTFLWINYRAITRLRRTYFESRDYQSALHARTLMVTEIPHNMRTDEGVVRIADAVKNVPDIPRGVIARNVKELPDLIEEHEELVRKLEAVLSKFLKKGTIPDKRPTMSISKKDPAYAKSKKVDSIDYLTNRIKELEDKINGIRRSVDQRNAMPYGFASYDSIEEAHTVAYAGRKAHPHGASIALAPRPADIIWKNLALTTRERRTRNIINNLWIVLFTIVWIIPNALIAVFLQNLGHLGTVWPAFQGELIRHPQLWAVVQGVLAPAITSVFYIALPTVFRRLRIQAGDMSKIEREQHVFAKLYAFFTVNNLLIFSLFGSLWQFLTIVIQSRHQGTSIVESLQQGDFFSKIMIALCYVSPFWITWLLQRNLGAAVDLSQLVNLAWGSFSRKFLSPTPRQLIEYSAPPAFDYANYYNYFLFYATVALCFATLQPLVLPVTALYFTLDSYLKKYLIMYVFHTKHESGGEFWRVLFNRFLFAIFLSNLIVALLVKAQGINWVPMLLAMAPIPFVLLAFKYYCTMTFDDQIKYYTKNLTSNESAIDDNKSRRSTNVAVRFGHPALYQHLTTPMVHKKSQHLLAQVYAGRIDDDNMDDAASVSNFSDVYSMSNMGGKKPGQRANSGPFEFVAESELDFQNFKNRPDFRAEFGGDGNMYGRAEDVSRAGTPVHGRDHSRSDSRDSNRMLKMNREESQLQGTVYPAGYHATPTSGLRGTSPGPDRNGWGSERNLVGAAAPMGMGIGRGPSPYTHMRTSSPSQIDHRGATPKTHMRIGSPAQVDRGASPYTHMRTGSPAQIQIERAASPYRDLRTGSPVQIARIPSPYRDVTPGSPATPGAEPTTGYDYFRGRVR